MDNNIDKENCSFNDILSTIGDEEQELELKVEPETVIPTNDSSVEEPIKIEDAYTNNIEVQNNLIVPSTTVEESNNVPEENIIPETNFNIPSVNTPYNETIVDKSELTNEPTLNLEETKLNVEDSLEKPDTYLVTSDIESLRSKSDDLNNTGDNNDNKKRRKIFNTRILYIILVILIFLITCVVVLKTFYLRDKVNNYEELIITVDKEEREMKIYSDKNKEYDIKNGAASELINCINKPVDTNTLPDEIKNTINEINNFYNSSNNYFAFVYKDIFTGFTVSYNENQNIFTASAIKAPTDIYIYERASNNQTDLNEELTYTAKYYNTGSGVLKNKSFNTNYNIKTLLEYSTVYSDNAAHNMLMDRYGRENMFNFWKEKGTTAIFSQNTNWGVLNAKDCLIYMNELYDFYTRDKEYGSAIMNNFLNATPKFITSDNNYLVANKSGWSGSVLHDVAIVFADNPYILVALSNTGATDDYMSYFNKISSLTSKLHTDYWKYKVNTCQNIKQY